MAPIAATGLLPVPDVEGFRLPGTSRAGRLMDEVAAIARDPSLTATGVLELINRGLFEIAGRVRLPELETSAEIQALPGRVSADDVEGASALVEITVSSGAFTAGAAANGLEFGAPASGAISKADGEIWSGAAASAGTAGWFRFYDNSLTTGADTASARFDGAISTSGAQLNMSSTAIASGATTTIDSFTITLPAS